MIPNIIDFTALFSLHRERHVYSIGLPRIIVLKPGLASISTPRPLFMPNPDGHVVYYQLVVINTLPIATSARKFLGCNSSVSRDTVARKMENQKVSVSGIG